jgi:hypothetical protein
MRRQAGKEIDVAGPLTIRLRRRAARFALITSAALASASLTLASASVTLAAAGAPAPARHQAPPLPTLNDGERFRVQPPTLSGWTFDGSQILGGPSDDLPVGYYPGGSFGRIEWTAWTPAYARGEGIVWTDDCEPSCGNGHWSGTATMVLAYRARRGTFQRMRFECNCEEPVGTRARFRLAGKFPPQWKIVGEW